MLNLEGVFTPLRGRGGAARADRAASTRTRRPREMQQIYQEPVKPELIAQRIREIKEQGVVCAASLTPQRVREYYEIALEAGLDILVIQGTVISAEHVSTDESRPPLNLKEFIREVAGPGRRRRLRLLLHRPAPDAHRRGRRARRRRSRRRLHDARRARHRRAAGDGDRRRRGRPLAAHARDRRVREGDRRRRHAQRRRHLEGVRLRRRRRDDRLAAGPRLRGARPRLPLGHGDVPPDAAARRARRRRRRTARSSRSCSARRTRTTARST